MRPNATELSVLKSHAKMVGLELTYAPDKEFQFHPWKFRRASSGFVWRVQDLAKVHYAIGNEPIRAKRLKSREMRWVGP